MEELEDEYYMYESGADKYDRGVEGVGITVKTKT